MRSTVIAYLVSMTAGLLSVMIPPYVFGSPRRVDSPLFSVLYTAYENLHLPATAILLITFGFLLGYFRPKSWLGLGGATMLMLPIAAVLEMIVSPTSHNLWPIEFAIYGLLAQPACIGAYVGSRISTKKRTGT